MSCVFFATSRLQKHSLELRAADERSVGELEYGKVTCEVEDLGSVFDAYV